MWVWSACASAAALHDGELVLGMSAPFTGASRGLGFEFYRGALAAIQEHKREQPYALPPVQLQCRDDGYNPRTTLENTIKFLEDDKVFCLFGYVGTPTTLRILPLLSRNPRRVMPLLFPFTGSPSLRKGPDSRAVAHFRASYVDEAEALVKQLLALGRRRIAVFYQADSFGRSGWDGVRHALARQDLQIHSEATYLRGDTKQRDFAPAVKCIAPAGQDPPDAIVCVGQYSPTAGFIRDARRAGLTALMITMSFVDTDNLLLNLRQEEEKTGLDLTSGVVGAQVAPSYEETSLPAVQAYRLAMERVVALTPPVAQAEDYVPLRYSMVGLEGYLAGRLFLEAVRRMGTDVRRDRLLDTLRGMGEYDLGIGAPLDFSAVSLQGSRRVYFTMFENDHVVPVRQWDEFRP